MTLPIRPFCLRCRRPDVVCVCAELRVVPSQTRVVFLQHPREARMPVSTCRLAHLSLPNSEMHVGMGPERLPRLATALRASGTMVLFPGPEATDVRALPEPPTTLVVIDGTWINARKLVERSPLLAALPRVGFTPTHPSNYRIRREPAPHCLSTIEATVHVLEALEGAPGRFTPMLASFERMVDLQLGYIRAGVGAPGRHARERRPSVAEHLQALGERLVLVSAEGGVSFDGPDQVSQLLQWTARRPATGAGFHSILRGRLPIANHVPRNMGLTLAQLRAGEDLATTSARWRAFTRPDDVWCTWGRYSVDLLGSEGVAVPAACLDLKQLLSNVAQAPLGGVEHLATSLGATLPEGDGRGLRKLVALERVVGGLFSGTLPLRAPALG